MNDSLKKLWPHPSQGCGHIVFTDFSK